MSISMNFDLSIMGASSRLVLLSAADNIPKNLLTIFGEWVFAPSPLMGEGAKSLFNNLQRLL